MLPAIFVLQLILVHPGAPGTPDEAQEFLDTLAAYVETRSGMSGVKIELHDEIETGLQAIAETEGAVVVADLTALCAAPRLSYRYVCSPLLSDRPAETVSLMALPEKVPGGPHTGPEGLQQLTGRSITGTLLSFPEYVDRLVFGGSASLQADFEASPRRTTLLAIKALRAGEVDLAMLSQSEVEALAGLLQEDTLAEAWRSAPIPGPPVLATGRVSDEEIAAIRRAFQGMCTDPEGAELCDTMGVTGFVQDGGDTLAQALESCWGPVEP